MTDTDQADPHQWRRDTIDRARAMLDAAKAIQADTPAPRHPRSDSVQDRRVTAIGLAMAHYRQIGGGYDLDDMLLAANAIDRFLAGEEHTVSGWVVDMAPADPDSEAN